MKLTAKNPVRKAVAKWFNTNVWSTKPGSALSNVNEVLHQFGFRIAEMVSWDDYQIQHSVNLRLETTENGTEIDSCLRFSWYRFPETGRYEITGYLS